MSTRIVRQHGDVASMRLGSRIADAGVAALVQELLSPSAFDLTFRTFLGSVETETGERRRMKDELRGSALRSGAGEGAGAGIKG